MITKFSLSHSPSKVWTIVHDTSAYLIKLGDASVWEFDKHLETKPILHSIIDDSDCEGYVELLVEVHWRWSGCLQVLEHVIDMWSTHPM